MRNSDRATIFHVRVARNPCPLRRIEPMLAHARFHCLPPGNVSNMLPPTLPPSLRLFPEGKPVNCKDDPGTSLAMCPFRFAVFSRHSCTGVRTSTRTSWPNQCACALSHTRARTCAPTPSKLRRNRLPHGTAWPSATRCQATSHTNPAASGGRDVETEPSRSTKARIDEVIAAPTRQRLREAWSS